MASLLGELTTQAISPRTDPTDSKADNNGTDGESGWQSSVSLNYPLGTMVVVAVLLFVVIVATATGNLLVVIALLRYRNLRTVSNYLIGNLAVSDFLLAITIFPLSTVNECLGYWVSTGVRGMSWVFLGVAGCFWAGCLELLDATKLLGDIPETMIYLGYWVF